MKTQFKENDSTLETVHHYIEYKFNFPFTIQKALQIITIMPRDQC